MCIQHILVKNINAKNPILVLGVFHAPPWILPNVSFLINLQKFGACGGLYLG